ncbi:sigma-54-dependent transcriptional regulator [Carnobacterium maltaromaticum]|uniref:sigma 54-interacting transcriptional regulator n=1 Tax=Carnobacterium TaxID=2747 RepID=UPI0007048F0B|nr:sigma-54-dependent transcriptional regulator [Carnobacterium maltaromaticum]KRN86258.1 transcriptional regulator [Carnobacterium maltaromaticum]MDT1946208.1 sigma 54-interacting transcriptional regulator [Carnobacterium maltaromaticum]MDT1999785.1 sigma 54-interacting transcriptional regulator [Carnobacterium maltaromaticum]TFJ32396.1 sigma-54-dependent transcriptional regulator [Carnobacterium maltaromaticum]TFJ35746.1 sigma-54-dependent transcriptional regulator [Carnobacterium maltaromat
MKRIEKIYLFVSKQSKALSREEVASGAGITTKEVAEAFGIQRTNASKDLNELVKDGLLAKIDGRPVRYLECGLVSQTKQSQLKKTPIPTRSKKEYVDIFQKVIGGNGSMKVPIEQAKAAILYPPRGLNCLITGATGSGKTHFAHIMFEFAKDRGLINGHEELVVFNCADYAHNSELLMSHLFGYAAGAFTGANKEKEGLIAKADGGMLFLDEIHRLPPEGQEMIFYFMDNGKYNRLGETAKERQADVRIICATTEDATSYLLSTFIRRIPISIQLPSFNQRQTKEKIDLVKLMVGIEAERIQRKISLTEDVVKALIGSVTYGNVGQLKSNIQLICARSFLSHMDKEEIVITLEDLTEEVKIGLSLLANNRQFLAELAQDLEPIMEVSPDQNLMLPLVDSYELPYNLYEIIDEKAALLKDDGVDQDSINQFIMTDINVHLKSFYKDHRLTFDIEKKLAEIVEQKVIDLTKKIYDVAKAKLNDSFQVNFIYAMSLHISSFLKRHQLDNQGEMNSNDSIRKMVKEYPAEYEVALDIKALILDAYQIEIPLEEVEYLTVLLVSLKKEKPTGRIGIVVAAHGNSTATSMVQVVKQLFGSDNLVAVDMPVEMKPRVALEEIINAVEQVNNGSGVILLVDMGSLGTFSEEIHRRTGILVRTVDMVTTALVLEVARKTELLDTDLDRLFHSLKNFSGYGNNLNQEPEQEVPQPNQSLKKAIVAICASGQGTAQRMKDIIEKYLAEVGEKELEVLPISIVEMAAVLKKLQTNYQLIAVTGIVDPKIGVRYIPMELLFSGEAKSILQELVLDAEDIFEPVVLDDQQSWEICQDYLRTNFTFINAEKVMEPFWAFTQKLTEVFLGGLTNQAFTINMIMHLGGMVERIVRQDCLTVPEDQRSDYNLERFQQVKEIAKIVEEALLIKIPPEELYYLVQILNNTLETEVK